MKTVKQNRIEFFGPAALIPEMPAIGHTRVFKATADDLGPHLHANAIELVLVVQGRGDWWVGDDERFSLRAGDMLLTHEDELHGTTAGFLERSEIYWIQLDLTQWADPLGLDQDALADVRRRLASCERTGCYHPAMPWHFDKILREHASSGLKRPFVRAHALALLDFALSELRPRNASHEVQERIARAQRWAIEHMSERWSVSDWAAELGLSEARFHEVFKREVGVPPKNWLNRERIREGAELLAKTRMPLTEVAFSVGFSSTQYFSTCFRQFIGITPSAHRERHEGQAAGRRSTAR